MREFLGEGSFSIVMSALNKGTQRAEAVKIIKINEMKDEFLIL